MGSCLLSMISLYLILAEIRLLQIELFPLSFLNKKTNTGIWLINKKGVYLRRSLAEIYCHDGSGCMAGNMR